MSFAQLMMDHNQLQSKHTKLRQTVDAYHRVSMSILSFMNYYLTNGGDPTKMPAQWEELDKERQNAYQNMLKAAELIS